MFVASAVASGLVAATPIGARLPIVAPIQALFVSDMGPVTRERWLGCLGSNQEAREDASARLDRAAARGWSVGVIDGSGAPDIDAAVRDYASGPRTPARERAFLASTAAMPVEREPHEIDPDSTYLVSDVAVAVPGAAPGEVCLVLKLGQLKEPVRGEQLLEAIARLQTVAELFARTRALQQV